MWNSIDKLSLLVNWLDYAGVVDIVAAIVLLIIWLINNEKSSRGLAFWGILLSFMAGGLWVFDAKAAHHLAQLQQRESEKQFNSQSKQLIDAESEVVALKKRQEPRNITKEQHDTFVKVLTGIPRQKIWILRSNPDRETSAFSEQIRKMLDDAGYGPIAPNDAVPFGGEGSVADGFFDAFSVHLPTSAKWDILIVLNTDDMLNNKVPLCVPALSYAFSAINLSALAIRGSVTPGNVAIFVSGKQQ